MVAWTRVFTVRTVKKWEKFTVFRSLKNLDNWSVVEDERETNQRWWPLFLFGAQWVTVEPFTEMGMRRRRRRTLLLLLLRWWTVCVIGVRPVWHPVGIRPGGLWIHCYVWNSVKREICWPCIYWCHQHINDSWSWWVYRTREESLEQNPKALQRTGPSRIVTTHHGD